MNIKSLYGIIDNFNNNNILIIGDIILDEYIWGKASRLSPEAPVPVLEVDRYSYILGGASNVANNISALGGKAYLAGVVGNDFNSTTLIDLLKKSGIDESAIVVDNERPTTVKTRLIAHNHQQLARADREKKCAITPEIQKNLLDKINSIIDKINIIILSDYAKGVLTPELISEVLNIAKSKKIDIIVDPKGLDFSKYKGVTLITPNRLEAETATKSPSGTCPEMLAKELSQITQAKHVLITLGEDGILAYSSGKISSVPAVTSEVYDVTGAGDSLISALALAFPATKGDVETSMIIGNYAAGVVVRKTGTTTVSPDELKEIIETDMRRKKQLQNC